MLAALFLLALFLSRAAFLLFVGAVLLVAQFEFYRALRTYGFRTADVLGLAAAGLMLVAAAQGGAPALTFALTLSVLATLLWYVVDPDRRGVTFGIGATLLGLVYVAFLGAHVVLMRSLRDGPRIALAFIALTVFYDISAYAFGSNIGRRAIAPSISPHKTLEGALGASAVVLLLGLVGGALLDPFSAASGLAMGLLVAVIAPLGDLVESLIKRDLGVKDMGTVLPGHGGVLDRIDALLFVAPAWYWGARALVA